LIIVLWFLANGFYMKNLTENFALLVALFKDERAVAAVEYALVVSLISVAAIAAMVNVGQQVSITFEKIASALDVANNRLP
jgi:Flp pilus assembly pilin Flp